jgi:predicted nucleic acid-binding protein
LSEYFVDTSALAKRHIIATGSAWVRGWIRPRAGNVIVISALATVEPASLLMRRERAGTISTLRRTRALNNFLLHAENEYLVFELDEVVLEEARNALVRHLLRALDALHLASAVVADRDLGVKLTFISADVKLLPAAAAEGFTTDDPNLHP